MNTPSAASAGARGRLTRTVAPSAIPTNAAGRMRLSSVHAASRHCARLAVNVATPSSAVANGTAKVNGNACASAGTAMIDEPNPVAPNIVYAASITTGTAASTYQGTSGRGSGKAVRPQGERRCAGWVSLTQPADSAII